MSARRPYRRSMGSHRPSSSFRTTPSVTSTVSSTTVTSTTIPSAIVASTTTTIPSAIVASTTTTIPSTIVASTTTTISSTIVASTTTTIPSTVDASTTTTTPSTIVASTTTTISSAIVAASTTTTPSTSGDPTHPVCEWPKLDNLPHGTIDNHQEDASNPSQVNRTSQEAFAAAIKDFPWGISTQKFLYELSKLEGTSLFHPRINNYGYSSFHMLVLDNPQLFYTINDSPIGEMLIFPANRKDYLAKFNITDSVKPLFNLVWEKTKALLHDHKSVLELSKLSDLLSKEMNDYINPCDWVASSKLPYYYYYYCYKKLDDPDKIFVEWSLPSARLPDEDPVQVLVEFNPLVRKTLKYKRIRDERHEKERLEKAEMSKLRMKLETKLWLMK